jgi:hypothetical protein
MKLATPIDRLMSFIIEREAIRLRVAANEPATDRGQWTRDPILQQYRFCNVRREHDRVTRWISDNWRTPNATDPDLWFAMLVARFVNWPETLAEIGYPVPWSSAKFMRVMGRRKENKLKCYGGAYMIRADSGTPGRSTAEYQVIEMFDPMWARCEELRPRTGDTLNSYHMMLGQLFGLGSFMAAQIVADLKYVSPLREASDWWTFAASGPGSRRGLNRVLDRPKDAPWTEENWRTELGRLQIIVADRWDEATMGPPIHAQDLQNCLCEIDKYERVRLGEGRLRTLYKGVII